jgi:hypothetical protein
MSSLRMLAAAAALTLGCAVPVLAQNVAPTHVTLHTALSPEYVGAGAFGGTLNLDIFGDGIVTGFYRADDTVTLRQVTGGLSGDRIWIDLGFDRGYISGTYRDGKIDAYTGLLGIQPYRFTAVPAIPPHL